MKSRIDLNRENDEQKEVTTDATVITPEVQDDCEDEVFEMLAGYEDENGTVHKKFTIREMTGKDEEAIQKADVKNNGSKIVSTILIRCVQSIGTISKKDVSPKEWENIIKSLFVGDQDYIMMQIRKRSLGNEIETDHVCPEPDCKAKLHSVIDIDELEIKPFMGERVIPFTLKRGYRDKKGVVHTEGYMRLPNGFDREVLTPLARKNLAKAQTLMLTRICKFKDGAYVDENVMSELTTKDRSYLAELLQENNFGIEMTTTVECDVCGEEFKASLNAANFL